MIARYRPTLELLAGARVEFIVVGGIAAVLQGAPITTFDLDVVHRRTEENVARLVEALEGVHARYRHDPRGLVPTRSHLMGAGHLLLSTDHGPLDLLGTLSGGLAFEDLIADTVPLELPAATIPLLELSRLIEVKLAAGRPKDLAVIPMLRATLEESRRRSGRPGPGSR